MTVRYEMSRPEDRGRFMSFHHLRVGVEGHRELVILSGVALVDVQGGGGNRWRRETIELLVSLADVIPRGKALRLEHWVPFVTINATHDGRAADDGGYAVDEFRIAASPGVLLAGTVMLVADVAVRAADSKLARVGFYASLLGRLEADPAAR